MCVCVVSFSFGDEGGMWDLVVIVPDHCLSIYFTYHFCEKQGSNQQR